MFKSTINAVFGHKQLVITALAISVLGFYASVDTMSASAQQIVNVPVPCQPYCNINLQDVVVDDLFTIHFSLVPFQ
jgi:hypothetical protein